jgi:uncharacterized protein YjiS (DUF1127 family)
MDGQWKAGTAAPARPLAAKQAASRLASWWRARVERRRQRRYLATLDDRALGDLGLSRAQILPDAEWRR